MIIFSQKTLQEGTVAFIGGVAKVVHTLVQPAETEEQKNTLSSDIGENDTNLEDVTSPSETHKSYRP